TSDSDMYDVLLTSPAGGVTVASGDRVSVTLRAVAPGPPQPVMLYRAQAGGVWRPLGTREIGRDNFGAAAPGPGQYLLVQRHAPGQSKTSNGNRLLVISLGIVLAALVLAVALVRMHAREVIS